MSVPPFFSLKNPVFRFEVWANTLSIYTCLWANFIFPGTLFRIVCHFLAAERHALKKGTACFGCNWNLKFSNHVVFLVLVNCQAKCRNLKSLSMCAGNVFQVWLCLPRSLWFDKVHWHLDFVLLSMYS